MPRTLHVWVTASAALLSLTACGDLATRRTIEDSQLCEQCTIELERVATLGDLRDPGSPGLFAKVSADSRGLYYVAPAVGTGEILVYDSRGGFSRAIGGTGEGPGEFRQGGIIRVEVGPDDTLYVLDRRLRRLTAFSPDHEVAWTDPLPFTEATDVWALPGGNLLVQGWSDAQSASEPRSNYHLYIRGDVIASLGRSWPDGLPASYQPEASSRPRNGRFWTVLRRQYAMAEWSVGGGAARRLLFREAEWFPPDSAVFPEPGNLWKTRPEPYVQGVERDDAGRLWVTTLVADEDWEPEPPTPRETPISQETMNLDGLLDTVVEVIDPDVGGVLARRRFDQALQPVRVNDGAGALFSYGLEDDVPVIIVWKITLNEDEVR